MKAWQCLSPHPDAVACGYSGAFVNRYGLPYEDTTRYVPALEVNRLHRAGGRAFGGLVTVAGANDVVVVGGGVVGTAVAYFASARGLSCTVLDKGRVGSGASHAASGALSSSPGNGAYAAAGTAQPEAISQAGPGHPRGVGRGYRVRAVRRADPRLR